MRSGGGGREGVGCCVYWVWKDVCAIAARLSSVVYFIP